MCRFFWFTGYSTLAFMILEKPHVWEKHGSQSDSRILNFYFKYFEFSFQVLKGCVRYIFASLFCMSKREHL